MIINKKYKVWLVVLASLVELGMVILSLFSLIMFAKAQNCKEIAAIQVTTFGLSIVMFIRCF